MALRLSQELPSGVSFEYHRISAVHIGDDQIQAQVESYLSSEARSAGKFKVKTDVALIPKSSVDLSQSLLPQLYNLLKSGPFSGAQDC